jgi:2-dehydro-3-deoxygluconokinase
VFTHCRTYIAQGKKIAAFGEIMLRLSPPLGTRLIQTHIFEVGFAGAEADFVINLALLGVPVDLITKIPNNVLGDKCVNFLRQFGVGVSKIIRGGERLGVYFIEVGIGPRPSRVLYDRSYSSFAMIRPEEINWREALRDVFWFHITGITPAISQNTAETCEAALKVAKELGITVSCDLNYRAQLWRWCKSPGEVMSKIVSYADVLISNEEEAGIYFGIKVPGIDPSRGKIDPESYRYVAEELMKKFPNLRIVAITLRTSISASHNKWTAVLYDAKNFYKSYEYDILPIVDREGAGDAFAAALVYGLIFMEDLQSALDFAVAASCLKHTIPGAVNLIHKDEIKRLLKYGTSARIIR